MVKTRPPERATSTRSGSTKSHAMGCHPLPRRNLSARKQGRQRERPGGRGRERRAHLMVRMRRVRTLLDSIGVKCHNSSCRFLHNVKPCTYVHLVWGHVTLELPRPRASAARLGRREMSRSGSTEIRGAIGRAHLRVLRNVA
jgi:hypothetical protein